MTRPTVKLPLLLFAGSLLMQTAWILALPPFRGSDEVDHAYRAASVALGGWVAQPASASDGNGELVVVPRSLVRAARPVCESYGYTGPGDCRPVLNMGDGLVTVDSSAAAYNPLFYWTVGTPSRAFSGDGALYTMRATAALLCSLSLALAGWATSLWARSRWPVVALLVAMSPVAIYSTAVMAPNGVEMCAALATWMALLGLLRRDLGGARQRALAWAAVPGALVLVTVRSLGPLWLGLIVLTVIALAGRRWTATVVRRLSTSLTIATTLVLAATIAALGWMRMAHTLTPLPTSTPGTDPPVPTTLGDIPLWFFESIAAFPTRFARAPALVYLCCLAVGLALVALGYRVARRRVRVAFVLTLTLTILVPVVLQLATFNGRGAIWQGRYGLPFSFGVILVLGLALDAARPRHPLIPPALLAGGLALAVANIVGVANVLADERANSPLSGTSHWLTPATWLVVLPMLLGWVCWAGAARWPSPQGRLAAEAAEADDGSIGAPAERPAIPAGSAILTQ